MSGCRLKALSQSTFQLLQLTNSARESAERERERERDLLQNSVQRASPWEHLSFCTLAVSNMPFSKYLFVSLSSSAQVFLLLWCCALTPRGLTGTLREIRVSPSHSFRSPCWVTSWAWSTQLWSCIISRLLRLGPLSALCSQNTHTHTHQCYYYAIYLYILCVCKFNLIC